MPAKPNPAGASPRPVRPAVSFMSRGNDALKASEAAAIAAKRGDGPMRFWLPRDGKPSPIDGEPMNESWVVILDETLNDMVGITEHAVQVPGRSFPVHEICAESVGASCTLCNQGNKPYYITCFSALVPRAWKSKDGKKEGNCSKNILAIKSSQLAMFKQVLTIAANQNGGRIRGVAMYLTRDLTNEMSAAVGQPTLLESGMMYEMWSDDDLAGYANEAVKTNEGKILKPEGDTITPFDWEKVFIAPDPEALRVRYKGAPIPGSRAEVAETEGWGDTDADDEIPGLAQDEGEAAQVEAPPTPTTSAPARRRAPAAAQPTATVTPTRRDPFAKAR